MWPMKKNSLSTTGIPGMLQGTLTAISAEKTTEMIWIGSMENKIFWLPVSGRWYRLNRNHQDLENVCSITTRPYNKVFSFHAKLMPGVFNPQFAPSNNKIIGVSYPYNSYRTQFSRVIGQYRFGRSPDHLYRTPWMRPSCCGKNMQGPHAGVLLYPFSGWCRIHGYNRRIITLITLLLMLYLVKNSWSAVCFWVILFAISGCGKISHQEKNAKNLDKWKIAMFSFLFMLLFFCNYIPVYMILSW